jgi:hypothetical protein
VKGRQGDKRKSASGGRGFAPDPTGGMIPPDPSTGEVFKGFWVLAGNTVGSGPEQP